MSDSDSEYPISQSGNFGNSYINKTILAKVSLHMCKMCYISTFS